jgi:hypothetical protein
MSSLKREANGIPATDLGYRRQFCRAQPSGGTAPKLIGVEFRWERSDLTSLRDDRFNSWIADLEARHLAELTFAEVARALRSLSLTYVERRSKLGEGTALAGAGKRAAFALFYGPLHFLLVREIVTGLGVSAEDTIVDLGCGTGAAGAAWASSSARPPAMLGVDRHPWALDEAARTYRLFGLNARLRRGDIAHAPPASPKRRSREGRSWVAAFTMNELAEEARETVLTRLLARGKEGDRVLVVEPVARGAAPWWDRWKDRFVAAGGRADEWRVRVELPAIVAKLDRAAGLDHRELTGRSLWIRGQGRKSE